MVQPIINRFIMSCHYLQFKFINTLFLFCIWKYEGINGCQNVYNYIKLELGLHGKGHLMFDENDVIIQNGNQTLRTNPEALDKTIILNSTFSVNSANIFRKFKLFCDETCNYQCFQHKNLTLCVVTAKLSGCPISSSINYKKKVSSNIDYKKCTEDAPFIFIRTNNTKKLIGYHLECHSSKWGTLKKPFDQLISILTNNDDLGDSKKLFALFSTRIGDNNLYGICKFGLDEIVNNLIDKNAMINVKNNENNWWQISGSTFAFSIDQQEGFIENKNKQWSMFDLKFNQGIITNFIKTKFAAFDRKFYDIYFFSTTEKVIKRISGNSMNFTYDLWCFNEGEENYDLKIWKHRRLLVYTSKNLYSLPLHNCNKSLSCSTCVKDPHCRWIKEDEICMGFDALRDSKELTEQDISNGNIEKLCSSDFEIKHTNLQEQLTRIEDLIKNNVSVYASNVNTYMKESEIRKRNEKNLSKYVNENKQGISDNSKMIKDIQNNQNVSELRFNETISNLLVKQSLLVKYLIVISVFGTIIVVCFIVIIKYTKRNNSTKNLYKEEPIQSFSEESMQPFSEESKQPFSEESKQPRGSIATSTATDGTDGIDFLASIENENHYAPNALTTTSILHELSITHIDERVIEANETIAPLAQPDSLKDELLNLNVGKPARRNSDTVATRLTSEAFLKEEQNYLMELSDKINALKEKINFKEEES